MSNKPTSIGSPDFEVQLSRYFDGELSPEESSRIEARLLEDPDAQMLLERFDETRSLLRDSFHAEVTRTDFSDFWTGIEAEIDRQGLVPGRAPQLEHPRTTAGWWERLKAWTTNLGFQPMGFGLAMAASALLAVGVSLLSGQNMEVASSIHLPPMAMAQELQIDPATGNFSPLPDEKMQPADPDQVASLMLPFYEDDLIQDGTDIKSLSGDEDTSLMILSSADQATIIWVTDDTDQGESSI